MLPGARQALRRIGRDADALTVDLALHPRPGRCRVRSRLRARAVAPGGRRRRVPARPAGSSRAAPPLRTRRRPGGDVRVAAGRPQGTGPARPGSAAACAPGCPGRGCCWSATARTADGCAGWPPSTASPSTWCSPARCRRASCPPTTPSATCSRCRAAPAAAGWTSRVSGIVLLEAAAAGLPVVAGDSGGAPETVQRGPSPATSSAAGTPPRSPTPSPACWPTRTGRADGRGGPGVDGARLGLPALVQRLQGLLGGGPECVGSARPGARQAGWLDPRVDARRCPRRTARHDRTLRPSAWASARRPPR